MRDDEIRRELVLDAPVEKVWEAITTANHLSRWFGDSAEIDLRPGGRATFGWSEFDNTTEAIVDVVDAPTRFSFRWDAIEGKSVEECSTHVEFTLTPEGSGTRLTLVESGFAALPEEHYRSRYDENSSGWTSELDDLSAYLAAGVAVGS